MPQWSARDASIFTLKSSVIGDNTRRGPGNTETWGFERSNVKPWTEGKYVATATNNINNSNNFVSA